MFKDAAGEIDPGVWPTVGLILFVVFFVGVAIWLYWPGRKSDLEPYKEMPLDEEDRLPRADKKDSPPEHRSGDETP